jgi:hypothetical protein
VPNRFRGTFRATFEVPPAYEQPWVDTVHFFHHPCDGRPQGHADTGEPFTEWHTVTLEWTPGRARYFLDGHLYRSDSRGVASRPPSWVLRNESALYGAVRGPRLIGEDGHHLGHRLRVHGAASGCRQAERRAGATVSP